MKPRGVEIISCMWHIKICHYRTAWLPWVEISWSYVLSLEDPVMVYLRSRMLRNKHEEDDKQWSELISELLSMTEYSKDRVASEMEEICECWNHVFSAWWEGNHSVMKQTGQSSLIMVTQKAILNKTSSGYNPTEAIEMEDEMSEFGWPEGYTTLTSNRLS